MKHVAKIGQIVSFLILFALIGVILVYAKEISVKEVGTAANAGFTFLELLLMAIGVPAGGLALILVRVARKGTRVLLDSLDSNPAVDNKTLLIHAIKEGDETAKKLFKKINPDPKKPA